MRQFIVDEQADGKSLIRVILALYPTLSLGQVRAALRKRDIRINGRRTGRDEPVAVGDAIAVYLPDGAFETATQAAQNSETTEPPYQIVYQDPMIILVNKRPGITVHQAGGSDQGPYLIDQLRSDFQDSGLTLCHRLDRQTGGLLLIARKPAALSAVQQLMRDGMLVKRYRCLTRGVPQDGESTIAPDGLPFKEITAWLEKDASHSDVYIHDLKQPGDQPIITRYRVLNVWKAVGPGQEDVAELEVELVTGRTHQIRAHFAHLGHPLLGDGKYGRNSFNRHFRGPDGSPRRQQLYSTQLIFSPACSGPLAYLAGRSFRIEPAYDVSLGVSENGKQKQTEFP